jgi:hypothetical protein
MGLPEKVALHMALLPIDQQLEVLDFVVFLAGRRAAAGQATGAVALRDWTDADFARLSTEAWPDEAEAVTYTPADCRESV